METGFFHLHSGLRYLIVLMLVVVIVKAILNTVSKKEWSKGDSKLSMILMSSTHLQMVIGLVMYILAIKNQGLFSDMGDTMGNAVLRWKAVEHPLMMFIFIILVSVLHITNKKEGKKNRNRRALIMGGIAIAVALSAIPADRWF